MLLWSIWKHAFHWPIYCLDSVSSQCGQSGSCLRQNWQSLVNRKFKLSALTMGKTKQQRGVQMVKTISPLLLLGLMQNRPWKGGTSWRKLCLQNTAAEIPLGNCWTSLCSITRKIPESCDTGTAGFNLSSPYSRLWKGIFCSKQNTDVTELGWKPRTEWWGWIWDPAEASSTSTG